MFGFFRAFRTPHGGAAVNTVRPNQPTVHLRLRFLDPEGNKRDFPPNVPVRVNFVEGTRSAQVPNVITQAGGNLVFNARTSRPWRSFTLEFPAAEIPYVICERLGSPPRGGSPPSSPPNYTPASTLGSVTGAQQRYFALPRDWVMRQADWSPPPVFTGNGRFCPPEGRIYHTAARAQHIGSPPSPVVLVLDPHWKFLRFEYYDRAFGNAHLDSPPRAAHRRRVSIPAVSVAGFRNDPSAGTGGSPPDAHSNWTIPLSPPGGLVQCLPFILQRNAAGRALSPPTGRTLGLRFRTPPGTFAYSQDAQTRVLTTSPPPPPGRARLRYYDLPGVWKSRGYYTRRVASSPPAPGKSFQDLTAAEITGADRRTQPLVFSLDDIVLCVGDPATGNVTGVLSPPADAASPPSARIALFNHRFDNRVGINSSAQGVYKTLSPPAPDAFDLPRSNVTPVRNYVHDYPDWTRLVICRGNLHDVFDKRTLEAHSPPGVVGARAAVRWMDATAAFGVNTFTLEQSPPPAHWQHQADNLPRPGRLVDGVPARVDVPAANPLFAIQAYYQQRTPDIRYSTPYNTGNDAQIGRYDIALLRCCDEQNRNEVAVNLAYLRSSFDFNASPPLSPPLAVTQAQYAQRISQNVANRWSGNDPAINTFRAHFLPQILSPPLSPPVPLRVDAIWFPQAVRQPQAHFEVDLWNAERDNRGSQLGSGKSGANSWDPAAVGDNWFAVAHETGHMGALPDEYNERWDGASYRQISFKANLPGDPYEPDGRNETGDQSGSGMMNGNRAMRNRYFWHGAEWVRDVIGTPLRVVYRDFGGTTYNNYWLPRHGGTRRTYYPWPLDGRLNQAVSPPAPPAPSPPVAYPQQWGRYDLFLYALGRDHYAARIINAHATAAAPFDAVLVIAIKITCELLPVNPAANLGQETGWRETMLQHLAAGVRTVFNNKWGFSGSFSPPTWRINKGLIHVVPQVVVENHSPPWDATRPAGEQLIPVATAVRNDFGVNYQVRVDWVSPPASRWSPPGRRLILEMQDWARLDGLFGSQVQRMLGINKVPALVTAADLQRIVRLILPGATVRRLP